MFIDEVVISVRAGNGGKGAVAFNSNLRSLGPTGGSGGKGGGVYVEGTSDLAAFAQFRFKKDLIAENGMDGRPQFRDGNSGKDLILKIPVGTVIKNLTNETETEIIKIGERVPLATGGRGGKGNFLFRSARNTSPQEFQPGLPGESSEFHLELKLIADIGLVGLPNTGKSSLLNELTRAKSKTANYHFTTLEPHLGTYYELILADIPGLIEGSAKGKGLGIKFLRHIERTRILFHCISAESSTPKEDYKLIRTELKSYSTTLLKKEEYIFLTKSDLASEAELKEKLTILKKLNKHTLPVSIHDKESMDAVRTLLNKIKKEKERVAT